VRRADSHLTPQEFELVLFTGSGPNLATAERAQAQEAQRHLERCEYCRSVAKQYSNVDSVLGRLRAGPNPVRKEDCPEESLWLEVATGLSDEGQSAKLLEHAAQCDYCGSRLREAAEDLTAQPSEEVKAVRLAKTPVAIEDKGQALVRQLKVQQEKHGFVWWPRLVWAAAGLAVVLAAASLVWLKTREPDVNKLLAEAYTEQRTIELRMPGAEYGSFRGELGPSERPPQKLYAAEAIITRESPKHPDDPKWLQAQARADLLLGHYSDAKNELDNALLLEPNDPSLLIDIATALYQRARTGGVDRSIDYGDAAEDLSKVLKQNPDNAVALFNRSIVYERMQLKNEAIVDLKRYLSLDPGGPWADEARARLRRLEERVAAHEHALAKDLVEAAAFAHMAQHSAAELDQRIEDYQDLAIKKWLPRAFSADANPRTRREALAALQALGNILSTRHQDEWLNDLLAVRDSDVFALAIASLRDAVADSDGGKHWDASVDAAKAATLFGQAGNRAGVLRAWVEEVHALQRTLEGSDCLAQSSKVATSMRGLNYYWIRAQLEIEQSACSIKLGRFDAARSFISSAERDTQAGHYPFLQLRSMGIAASIETDAGNLVGSWRLNEQGLAKFWETDFAPMMRAHQFYDDLVYPAETLHQWNLALALAEESASTISLTDDRVTEAAVRQHLAKLAIQTQNFYLAAEQLQKSKDLYAILPSTDATKNLDAYADIAEAEIDAQEGRIQQAGDKLVAVKPKLANVSDFTISLAFYQIYGNVLQTQNRSREAEIALERAVGIAEANLKDLRSPKERSIWSQETSPVYRSLVSLELAKGDHAKGLSAWELYLSAPFRSGITFGPATNPSFSLPDLHPLMSQLADQTVVSYALLPEGLAAWVFDDRGIHSKFIRNDPSEISLLAHRFASMCADRTSDLSQLRLAGRELYDLFIAPVDGWLTPARTLVIESDERLSDIPFQALFTPNDHYLIESFRVAYSPGVIYQSKLKPASVISADAQALVVASSANTAGHGLTLVPVNAVEAGNEIAKMFASPFVLSGDMATLSNVEARLPEVDVFHYVGHAISDFAREGLLLPASHQPGQATIWGSEQIKSGLFTRNKLVVLAACSTGKNYYDRRESHGEFVRTVLAAGVPHVVASRWDVDSEATKTFMEHFYLALLSGKSVSAAVQVAATDLQLVSSTEHPYYWAAFAAFGRA
jgi:CHAT domain-containing protein